MEHPWVGPYEENITNPSIPDYRAITHFKINFDL
jgi:hypothetical protein